MTTNGGGNSRFNAEAAAWDSNPDVHRASDSALEAILDAFEDLKQAKDTGSASKDGAYVVAFTTMIMHLRGEILFTLLKRAVHTRALNSANKQRLTVPKKP